MHDMKIILEALIDEPVMIEDAVTGRSWQVSPELTAAEAFMFRHLSEMDTDTALLKMATVIAKGMKIYNPEATPEWVLETFSYAQMLRIVIGFLRLNGRMPSFNLPPSPTKKRMKPKKH